jgi:hypothetical protein
VLGQQASRVQGLQRPALQAAGLQLQPQRMRAAGHAGGQLVQQFDRTLGIAVVERPFGGQQPRTVLHAMACSAARARAGTAPA